MERKERVLWLYVGVAIAGGLALCICTLLLLVVDKLGGLSATSAAWVQAIGSVGAILVSVWIASRQYRQQRKDAQRREYGQAYIAFSQAYFAVGAVREACMHANAAYRNGITVSRVRSQLEDARENLRTAGHCTDPRCASALFEVKRCLVDALALVDACEGNRGRYALNPVTTKLADRAEKAGRDFRQAIEAYSASLGSDVYGAIMREPL